MSTLKEIGNKLFKEDLASQKVELGLVQDITKDLDTVAASLNSIRPALIKIEDLLIKNFKTVELANLAILKVQEAAKEIGADTFIKELDKPKTMVKEYNNTINLVLKSIQNGVASL
jgi:hypothetical protein